MSKNLKIFLAVFFLFQVLIAAGFDLAHDEAYYWLYSKNLDWGYFDHPPMVGLTIKVFSFLPHQEWALRIGFIVQQVLSLILLLKLVPIKHHWKATLLFLAFPLASFSGIFALPDMPLLFMTALYCWMLKRYLEQESTANIIGLGTIIPCLLYSKYHGILLIFFTIVALPKLLTRKSFYLIAALAIIIFLPHVWWQYEHDFSTLRYHFLERPTSEFSLKRIGEYVGLQIGLAGLFVGPVVWWSVIKHKPESEFQRAMKFMGIGIVLFFLFSTFSKKFEANWTILASIPLITLAVLSPLWDKKLVRGLLITSFSIVLIVRLLLVLPANAVTIKRFNEFKGWKDWSQKVATLCQSRKIVANTYQIASKLSYYLNQEVPALNYHSRKNQFDYWNFQHSFLDQPVCYLTDKQEFQGEEIAPPEGKMLRMVPYSSARELWKLKDEQAAPQ